MFILRIPFVVILGVFLCVSSVSSAEPEIVYPKLINNEQSENSYLIVGFKQSGTPARVHVVDQGEARSMQPDQSTIIIERRLNDHSLDTSFGNKGRIEITDFKRVIPVEPGQWVKLDTPRELRLSLYDITVLPSGEIALLVHKTMVGKWDDKRNVYDNVDMKGIVLLSKDGKLQENFGGNRNGIQWFPEADERSYGGKFIRSRNPDPKAIEFSYYTQSSTLTTPDAFRVITRRYNQESSEGKTSYVPDKKFGDEKTPGKAIAENRFNGIHGAFRLGNGQIQMQHWHWMFNPTFEPYGGSGFISFDSNDNVHFHRLKPNGSGVVGEYGENGIAESPFRIGEPLRPPMKHRSQLEEVAPFGEADRNFIVKVNPTTGAVTITQRDIINDNQMTEHVHVVDPNGKAFPNIQEKSTKPISPYPGFRGTISVDEGVNTYADLQGHIIGRSGDSFFSGTIRQAHAREGGNPCIQAFSMTAESY